MTGPSTMAHHHELHALLAAAEARLMDMERFWIARESWIRDELCEECDAAVLNRLSEWGNPWPFSRSPPERESGVANQNPERSGGTGEAGTAAARSGGDHRAHWFLAGDVLDVCAVCGRHLDAHDDLPEDENDDPDDERECMG